jgi:hypothetical protein
MSYHPNNYFLVGNLEGEQGYYVNAPVTPLTGDLPADVLAYSIAPPATPKVSLLGVDAADVVYLKFADEAEARTVLGLPQDEE